MPILIVIVIVVLAVIIIFSISNSLSQTNTQILGGNNPNPPPQVNSTQNPNSLNSNSPIFNGLATLAGVAIAAIAINALAKKGFSILQGIDWNALNSQLQQALTGASIDLNTILDNRARLDRAEYLVNRGQYIHRSSGNANFSSIRGRIKEALRCKQYSSCR